MTRREAITVGAACCGASQLRAAKLPPSLLHIADLPDSVLIFTDRESFALQRAGDRWRNNDVEVTGRKETHGFSFRLHSPKTELTRLCFRWKLEVPTDLSFLGDDWERSYGTLAWRHIEPERVMPWYFLASSRSTTIGCGVRTGTGALCFWQVDPAGVSLWLDVRNGGMPLQLGDRELPLASVVSNVGEGITPFQAAREFCRALVKAPRLPSTPIYGGNNWYYAYGKSSAADILSDSKRMADLAPSTNNRPFMVIDDGWSPNATAGPWSHGNAKFPDMARLAADMRQAGVQTGLWIRPLFTKEVVPESWRLHSPNALKEISARATFTLDPTVPDVRERIKADAHTAASWGYRLLKHDFSTYDLLGRWGFTMGATITDPDWSFADRSRTNAEIITALYTDLREGAGDAILLGCNTVGHLGAGIFEMQRTGDDTSGRDWNRTRKMGVNTLAFRAPQHGTFFAIDADCVGITQQIPWALNAQWLDLLARSGTPLFVSLAPDAAIPEINKAVRDAFAAASRPQPLLEPVDWTVNSEPEHWLLNGKRTTFHWFDANGVSPFAN